MKEIGEKCSGHGLLAGLFVRAGGPGEAETWCIRDAGSPPPGACVFPSSHECGMAARMNPFRGHLRARHAGIRNDNKGGSGRRAGQTPRLTVADK
jgi:hypothetical protein